MNRTQIATLYDSFPEDQQNMPREQFIREALAALDPATIAMEANAIAQQRMTATRNRAMIDTAVRESE